MLDTMTIDDNTTFSDICWLNVLIPKKENSSLKKNCCTIFKENFGCCMMTMITITGTVAFCKFFTVCEKYGWLCSTLTT